MDAREFRLNNYIKYLGTITKTDENFLYLLYDKFSDLELSDLEPIELTEEILLKCGFDKKSWFTNDIVIECIYYQKGNFIVYLLKKSFEVELISDSRQFNLFRNFKKELHILQNLYLLLENEELNVQL